MTGESELTRVLAHGGYMVTRLVMVRHICTQTWLNSQSIRMPHDMKQGLVPALVRSNGLRPENQQLCRDPCMLFECMLTSVSAVVRVSGLNHCANNDWDFILHHLKREYYWRWYLLPCKISKLVHPNCVLAPPPLGCKRRMQGKKIKMEESKLFWYIGIFLITPVSLQSIISCTQGIYP